MSLTARGAGGIVVAGRDPRHHTGFSEVRMIGAPLLLLLLLPAEDKPTPKLPLSKETTYVTGPLDMDGYIDYQAALNDRLGKGIAPE